jgi:hypothetical protein
VERPDGVLADGEATGHRHRIEDSQAAMLLDDRGQLYLVVVAPKARIVHDEPGPIELERGSYRVWQQREYAPAQATIFDASQPRFEQANSQREYDPAQRAYWRTVLD